MAWHPDGVHDGDTLLQTHLAGVDPAFRNWTAAETFQNAASSLASHRHETRSRNCPFGVNPQIEGMLKGDAFLCALWAMAILSVLNGLLKAFPGAPTVTLWRFIGQNTLIVLLTHTFFLSVINRTFNEKLIAVEPTGLFHMAVVLTIAVGGPIFGAWLIDRNGLTSLVFGKQRLFVSWRKANGKKAEAAFIPNEDRTPAHAPAGSMIGTPVTTGHLPLKGNF